MRSQIMRLATVAGAALSLAPWGSQAAAASLVPTVVVQPNIQVGFSSPEVILGPAVILGFFVQNADSVASYTSVSFSATLPSQLQTAGDATSACGGTVSLDPMGLRLSGATIAPGTTCSVQIPVVATAPGSLTVTTSRVITNQGQSASGAQATLKAVYPPKLTLGFAPGSVAVGSTTTVVFSLVNPATNNGLSVTLVTVVAVLPEGLAVASGSSSAGCGGTITLAAPNSIEVRGLAIDTTCQISIPVTATAPGSYSVHASAVVCSALGDAAVGTITVTGSLPSSAQNPPVVTPVPTPLPAATVSPAPGPSASVSTSASPTLAGYATPSATAAETASGSPSVQSSLPSHSPSAGTAAAADDGGPGGSLAIGVGLLLVGLPAGALGWLVVSRRRRASGQSAAE
jgi:hypothetical protein